VAPAAADAPALEGLDDRLLADIGLNRTQQRIECAKAPWQL